MFPPVGIITPLAGTHPNSQRHHRPSAVLCRGFFVCAKENLHMNYLMTPAQAAAYLNFSVATLAKWRCVGDGPTFIKCLSLIHI